jgi:hypothetical protein
MSAKGWEVKAWGKGRRVDYGPAMASVLADPVFVRSYREFLKAMDAQPPEPRMIDKLRKMRNAKA